MVWPHDRLQRERARRFQAQHAPPGVVQKERLQMNNNFESEALKKIDEGKTAKLGRTADCMKESKENAYERENSYQSGRA